ncbi:uncharacterized protein [Diadema antillarum]|uniref:uncharacterized protein n=1 Tax=Diadema antillarum TaxID=105358 RepID=UPI003A89D086
MFLLYINDLPDNLHSTVRLFANDCILYTSGNSQEDLDSLQEDLHQLEDWQNKWAMSFNPSKYSVMKISNKQNPPDRNYTFCGQPFQEATTHPYLGVEIDNKLRWDTHYKKITAKANKVLGFLRRNLWFCHKSIKTTAYTTLVRLILEYASSSWDPYHKGDIHLIESVQRKAARFCMNDYKQQSSVSQMLKDLEWDTLENRRRISRLQLLFKVMNGEVGIDPNVYIRVNDKGGRMTRGNSRRIQRTLTKKDVHKYSFFHRTAVDWNLLDEETVTSTSSTVFK